MRARLEQLDARGFELRIDDTLQATLGTLAGLRGELVHEQTHTSVEAASATRAEVTALAVKLATTRITAEAPVVLDELRGEIHRQTATRGDVHVAKLETARLVVVVGGVTIAAHVVLSNARLRLDVGTGAVFAERVTLTDLSVGDDVRDSKSSVAELVATQVTVEWCPTAVRVRAGNIRIGAMALDVAIPPAAPASDAPDGGGSPARNLDDLWPLLDAVSGQLDLDLDLDVVLPVYGHRRARHEFRVPIEDGALDFRQLESGLSRLEDSILDFSLRDETLVFEAGIPLLPTRGRGKPILVWDVSGPDLPLAQANRVRLAKLLQARKAGADDDKPPEGAAEPSEDGGHSSIELREFAMTPLNLTLRLASNTPPARLPIRSIGELRVEARLDHVARPQDEPHAGAAKARATDVILGALQLPLGAATLAIAAIRLDGFELDGAFRDLRPERVHGMLQGIALDDLDLAVPRGG